MIKQLYGSKKGEKFYYNPNNMELLKLRQLVQEQAQQLAYKDKIIKKQNIQLENMMI